MDLFAGEQRARLCQSVPVPNRIFLDLRQATEVSAAGLGLVAELADSVETLTVVVGPRLVLPAGILPPAVAILPDEPTAEGDGIPAATALVLAELPPPEAVPIPAVETGPPPQPAVTESPPRLRRQRIVVDYIGDVAVVTFVDKNILDEQNIQSIGDDLFRLVDVLGRRKLVLDFANVESMSSAAYGKWIRLHQRLKTLGGKLVVCNCGVHSSFFALSKLDKLFTIAIDQSDAFRCF